MPKYFSETRGLRSGYSLAVLRTLVRDLYKDLVESEHLKEWLGYHCVDEGDVPGTAGTDPGRSIRFDVGREDIWPPDPAEGSWSEDAIFDFLQFLGEKVSSGIPETGRFHGYANCGVHGEDFTPEPARGQYIDRVNKILARYGDGWEMTVTLEIVERAPVGMEHLLQTNLPRDVDAESRRRVDAAVAKYRRRSSSRDDRRDAVRDLGDVLEPLRKEASRYISKADESDLFNILNNFDLRHNNAAQKRDYDPIWLAALFYHYLAMIHVVTHLIARDRAPSSIEPLSGSTRKAVPS